MIARAVAQIWQVMVPGGSIHSGLRVLLFVLYIALVLHQVEFVSVCRKAILRSNNKPPHGS
jgi:hypothetical protein